MNAIFNAPTGDDLWFVSNLKEYGFKGAFSSFYYEHTGRILGVFINLIIAMFYDSGLSYKVVPIAILLVIWYIIKSVLCMHQLVEKKDRFYTTNLILGLFLTAMPSIYEGLYWTASSTLHLLPFFLSVYYVSCDISKEKNDSLQLLLILVIGLSNEILLCLLLLYQVLHLKSGGSFSKWSTLLIIGLILFHLFCPGNQARYHIHEQAQAFRVQSLGVHIGQYVFHFVKGVLLNPIFWFLLATTPLMIKVKGVIRINLVIAAGVAFVLFPIVSNYILTKHGVSPLRIINSSIAISIFVLLFYLPSFKWVRSLMPHIQNVKWILLLLFVPYCFVFKNSCFEVSKDLFSGKSYRYSQLVVERIKLITKSTSDVVQVPIYEAQPKSLCLYDIGPDSKVGEYLGRIYEKKQVRTEK